MTIEIINDKVKALLRYFDWDVEEICNNIASSFPNAKNVVIEDANLYLVYIRIDDKLYTTDVEATFELLED